MTIKVSKREHHMWLGWQEIREEIPSYPGPIFGRWHYIYESKKGRISLIELPNYFHDGVDLWEICGGGLTEDVEQFLTKEEAEKRIHELLDETKD